MKYTVGFKYKKNGFDYEVLSRVGDVVIAIQDGKYYEVFELQQNNERIISGVSIPASESPPSTEKWGNNAYTVYTLDAALKKAQIIQTSINNRK